jgi:hypothetical protein
MSKVIIELANKEQTNSMGNTTHVPVINIIYFKTDEDTGAQSVENITQWPMSTNTHAYMALHCVDWFEDFDTIEFHEYNGGKYEEVSRMDWSETFTAVRLTSYYIAMMFAHVKGYTDEDGRVAMDNTNGINLFTAYRNEETHGDYGPYLSAM